MRWLSDTLLHVAITTESWSTPLASNIPRWKIAYPWVGDIHVDTAKSHAVYKKWLAQTRPAREYSPNGERRPYWMPRPFKPACEFYRLEPVAE